MRLLFDAPRHHTLLPEGRGGPVVCGGETFDVSDPERALELLTDPHIDVVEVATDIRKLSRKELDEMADEAGIDPSGYRTKQDLIDVLTGGIAVEAPEAEPEPKPEPEAEDGEGHETPQED